MSAVNEETVETVSGTVAATTETKKPAAKEVAPPQINQLGFELQFMLETNNSKLNQVLEHYVNVLDDTELKACRKVFSKADITTNGDDTISYNLYDLFAKGKKEKNTFNGPIRDIIVQLAGLASAFNEKGVTYICNDKQLVSANKAIAANIQKQIADLFPILPEDVVMKFENIENEEGQPSTLELKFSDFVKVTSYTRVDEEFGITRYTTVFVIKLSSLAVTLSEEPATKIESMVNRLKTIVEKGQFNINIEIGVLMTASDFGNMQMVQTLANLVELGYSPLGSNEVDDAAAKAIFEGTDSRILLVKNIFDELPEEEAGEEDGEVVDDSEE